MDGDTQGVGAVKIFSLKNNMILVMGHQNLSQIFKLVGNSLIVKSRVTNELRTSSCDGSIAIFQANVELLRLE